MFKSALVTLTSLAITASVYAGDVGPQLGDTGPTLGSPFGMPALAVIGAVGLIAGIKYLRNKRS